MFIYAPIIHINCFLLFFSQLKPYNVTVTLGFPPDTDTPGYAEENKDKPEETRLISEASGLHSPESVAKVLMKDCLVFSAKSFENSLAYKIEDDYYFFAER